MFRGALIYIFLGKKAKKLKVGLGHDAERDTRLLSGHAAACWVPLKRDKMSLGQRDLLLFGGDMLRKLLLFGGITTLLLSTCALPTRAAINGDYMEARSADVYTGPCFANSEVGLTGQEAILAWKVREGSWKGIDLSGLSVVAVVRANATLGDPYHTPYPARSVLILDSSASPSQKTALAEFAASMAGNLLDHVVRVESSPHPDDRGARQNAW